MRLVALLFLCASAAGAAPLPRRAGTPLEQHPGIDVEMGSVEGTGGVRQRTIVTAPKGAGKLPGIFVVGWLSCDSVEQLSPNPRGADRLLLDLVRKSGALVMRIDKPGVGDSEGDCAKTDFEVELEGYRRAFAAFLQHPRLDASRLAVIGISNGGGFAPLVAGDAPVSRYVTVGGWSKTWFEHMIDLERRRVPLSGTDPARAAPVLKALAEFHACYLFDRMTPAEVARARPHLAGVWYDAPDSQYGRPARFYHQLQALDLAAAWGRVRVPTLVVWGEYDWIMDRADQEQIVRLVNTNGAGLAKLVVVPRADHVFSVHPDALAAFRHMGEGGYPDAAAGQILAFLRAR
jgi:pimeloyl-ACP methyl ester carboxylesterase